MRRPFEAWRRSLVLWGIPLAFCLLNLLILGFYSSFYAGEVERLEQRNRDIGQQLADLDEQSRQIEAVLGRIETQRLGIQRLYREYFATEAERFTEAIGEVKKLARDAGLNPTAFSYPQRVLAQEGLIQRQIQFSVEGTYQQLRTFINFLELTEQFLTLNSVSLAEGGPNRLSIRVQVSTVFAADAPARRATEAEAATGESL
jgi:Tfp pilus assembly protein PilO